jgi:orotate phosphoribosyltransferase
MLAHDDGIDIVPSCEYDPRVTDPLEKLFAFVNERAYREGEFTLASGKRSTYYFNGKVVLFNQEGAGLFARWLLGRLIELTPRPVSVGGLEIGAIPIACTAMALADFPLQAFVVRKKAKSHGTSLLVEGDLKAGDPVVIVDDVITTGESSLKAIRAVEEMGCKIVGIYCLIDRQEGHSPEFEKYRKIFHPAFTIDDFRRRRAALK